MMMFTCNVPILDSPVPQRGPVILSTRIRDILERINIPAFQIAYPEMMLWIIMIGGIASRGSENYPWFIELPAGSCRAAGIATKDELALFSREFLWSDFYLGPVFNDFWHDFTKGVAKDF